MAWIEVHTNLPRHDKTLQLQSLLKLNTPQALGHLLLLWIWALENSPDGSLRRLDARGLARTCQFNVRRAEEFTEALVASGFLDRGEGGLRIHDWEEYAGRYNVIRQRNARRQKEYRERNAGVDARNAHVTVLQDRTVEDRTEPDRTEPEKNLSSAAGGDGAPGRAQLEEFLHRRGLEPADCPGTDAALLAGCDALTGEIFRRFCDRPPTEQDRTRVFAAVTRQTETGARIIDPDRRDLLCYAFEQAADAGKAGVWPYIEAVLGKLHSRGLKNLDDAEGYDWERL